MLSICFFFCKQKTAYEMRISDWSSDVCSSDLTQGRPAQPRGAAPRSAPALGQLRLDRPGRRLPGQADQGQARRAAVAAVAQAPCRALEIGRASCRERVWQYV